MRKGEVFYNGVRCGTLIEDDDGYPFEYETEYLQNDSCKAISLTMPCSQKEYRSNVLFPFFDGLIPEGWVMEKAVKKWGIDQKDRMGLLFATCFDCVGAVSIKEAVL